MWECAIIGSQKEKSLLAKLFYFIREKRRQAI